jgi:hypothetical protein
VSGTGRGFGNAPLKKHKRYGALQSKTMRIVFIITLTVCTFVDCLSQTDVTKSFGDKYDFSEFLWTDKEYGIDGVYDETFHRIQFAFTKIEKSADNKLIYKVEGADRLKGIVTRFAGEIKFVKIIKHEGNIYHPTKPSDDKWITFETTFEFRENKESKGSGIFRGTFSFDLTFEKGKFIDNLWDYEGDGFSNFIYKGTWTSYLNGKTKKYVLGQGRLPDTGDFDSGVAMRVVNKKYEKNGWATDKDYNLIDNPKHWWKK